MLIVGQMLGKRQVAEALAKKPGAVLVRPDGVFRWDGKRWRKMRKPWWQGKDDATPTN